MSAAVTVQDAIYDALAADSAFATWLGTTVGDPRIYEGLAPAGQGITDPTDDTQRYVTLGGGSETNFSTMCAPGFSDALDARVWVAGSNERLAKQGYGHVRRILHGAALPLSGHTCLRCAVVLRATLTDPDGGATQAIAHIDVHSEVTS